MQSGLFSINVACACLVPLCVFACVCNYLYMLISEYVCVFVQDHEFEGGFIRFHFRDFQ